ncbi:type 1 glutamine amidotransferase domain-containing protein [Herbivorax sp. ANBcel31]|uniref:type 1 glutamine amidotransferase domain-containing protein n=1 Tax=Herbivorax sp. ANBcel31 TaxID=3069754 RepID=UPI0027B085B8|nr:type 1 glutamine amidotransferase domain-containing protein [Herbivorax sp. ANBcel31]MDQ2086472.1 type 1 glutamine amidotransferase domain-containing protein [Herbivorax sp. ANBcel31]
MNLKDKKVLSFIHSNFEDLEFWHPVLRLMEEGVRVYIAGEKAGETYVGKYGVPAVSDIAFNEINPDHYDGILVPGGWAPDKLRRFPKVLEVVRAINKQNKPIGHICHAGWVLISAGIVEDKKVTSTLGIKDDLENAGAIWTNQPVVVDGNIVSSRKPMDLPLYMKAFINLLKE